MNPYSLKFLTESESPHAYIQLLDQMTKKDRAISEAYCHYTKKVLIGEHVDVTPCRETIAARAGCSVSSVRNFIKKYEGQVFSHETRKKAGSNENDSNKYFMNMGFVETIVMLDHNNYFHCWKKRRMEVMKGLEMDDLFLVKKTLNFYKLSTTKLPTAYLLKLPSIKSYMNSSIYKCTLKTSTQNVVKATKKTVGIFADIDLTYAQIQRLEHQNALIDLEAARKDHHWFKFKLGRTVQSPYWFMQKQAEKNCIKRLGL